MNGLLVLVGTRNTLAKVFIIVLELIDHRGHLVLMLIKQHLFTAKPRTALCDKSLLSSCSQGLLGTAIFQFV